MGWLIAAGIQIVTPAVDARYGFGGTFFIFAAFPIHHRTRVAVLWIDGRSAVCLFANLLVMTDRIALAIVVAAWVLACVATIGCSIFFRGDPSLGGTESQRAALAVLLGACCQPATYDRSMEFLVGHVCRSY